MRPEYVWADEALHEICRLLPWGPEWPDGGETAQGLTCRTGVRNWFERIKDSGCLVSEIISCASRGDLFLSRQHFLRTPCLTELYQDSGADAGRPEERLEAHLKRGSLAFRNPS